MTDAKQAQEAWNRSAEGWIANVPNDVNRHRLLDGPMLELAGSVEGARVLDVGCGEGRFCRMLSERGADVWGIDPTPRLIEVARQRHPVGSYALAAAEALPFLAGAFDLAVSYITLVDIVGYREAIGEMARVLRPGGALLIANVQSFASTRPRAWYQDGSGAKLHLAVEDYFDERPLLLEWGGMSLYNWHRPLEAYMSAFLESGLALRAFREPRPSEDAVRDHPSMQDEYRVPLFHIMLWEKQR